MLIYNNELLAIYSVKFSQRNGYSEARKLVQFESVDDELKAGLWSITQLQIWDYFCGPVDSYERYTDDVKGSNLEDFLNELWVNYYKRSVDTIPWAWDACLSEIRDKYFASEWFEVLDFIEHIAISINTNKSTRYIKYCNEKLELENSAYRFISNKITPISNDQEVKEVESAIGLHSRFQGASLHLNSALIMLADRSNPDYRNSIKESISAVESAVKLISGDHTATLGSTLSRLEREYGLHPGMKSSFSAMYGYTSNANGIRHAMMELSEITKAEARYMLIVCSAFINYLADTFEKA